jgi:hypothetical protein
MKSKKFDFKNLKNNEKNKLLLFSILKSRFFLKQSKQMRKKNTFSLVYQRRKKMEEGLLIEEQITLSCGK